MHDNDSLLGSLPVLQRLALAYAPASARLPTLALLALDTRLASILRGSKEPMLAQLRLAWWREQLATDMAGWPEGEPLLQALRSWEGGHAALVGLVEGWEHLTGQAPLPVSALERFAEARGAAFSALAHRLRLVGDADKAWRIGRNWALADMALRLRHPEEQGAVHELLKAHEQGGVRLPSALRPLTVLHGMAVRSVRKGRGLERLGPKDFLLAVRLGLLGR